MDGLVDCLFCQIISRKVGSNIILESKSLVVFPDIHPAADLHYLVVPKEHIASLMDIGSKGNLLVDIFKSVKKLVEDNNLLEGSYRLVINGGKSQKIPHLHFHLLGGKWKIKV